MAKKRTKILITLSITIISIFIVFLILNREGSTDPQQSTGQSTGFPFSGSNTTPPVNNTNSTTTNETDSSTIKDPTLRKLFKIAEGPIAGAVAFDNSNGLNVRYTEKAKGHSHNVLIDASLKKERVSANTIPKVQKAYWRNDGKRVVLQYISTNSLDEEIIRSHSVSFSGSTSTIESFFFPDNSLSLTLSPDTDKVAFLMETSQGSHLITSPIDENNPQQIYYSPLKEWLIDWSSDNTINLTTKPSFEIPGYSFTFSITNNSFTKILDDMHSLTTNSQPNGSKILYSQHNRNGSTLSVMDSISRENTSVPFKTLSEKCVWSNDLPVFYCGVGKYSIPQGLPDNWYKGIVGFNDSIWVYNAETNKPGLLVDPLSYISEELDIINLFLSPNEEFLFFTNKKDGSLWGANLKLER